MYFTEHAKTRMAQRGLTQAAVDAALYWGESLPQSGEGTHLYWLSDRAVAKAQREGVDVSPYRNTALVITDNGTVISVFLCTNPRKVRGRTHVSRFGSRRQRNRHLIWDAA